uniref:Peptidase A2 domain-containing protein n=1 Tax=Timema cristinae TaxID=61476 RepID=A0A7R9H395_TIMCR|nr:unnamed protein product [Timema cristinae]
MMNIVMQTLAAVRDVCEFLKNVEGVSETTPAVNSDSKQYRVVVGSVEPYSAVFVEVKLWDEPIDILIDTGAAVSLIDEKVWRRASNGKLQPTNRSVINASGDNMTVLGTVSVPVRIGSYFVTQEIIVAKGLTQMCLIDTDFLRRNKCDVLLSKGIMRVGEGEVPLNKTQGEPQPGVCRVSLKETIVIPSGHEVALQAAVSADMGMGVLETNSHLSEKHGIFAAHVVVSSKDKAIPVRLPNPHPHQVNLYSETNIGSLIPCVIAGTPLKDIGAVQPEDDPELIQRVCGVLDVNSFEVRAPGLPSHAEHLRLRAVYLQAALMAHHCIANTHLAVDDNFIITVHASVHISQGQPIFFNYTSPLQGTSERREHLHEGKYFDCTCSRCRDPTELGTYMSSLKCVKCRGKGLVSPVEALKENSPWECNQCGHYYSALVVHSATARGKDLLEDIDKTSSDRLVSVFLLAASSDRLVSAFLLATSSDRLLNSFLLTESSDRLVSVFLLAASSDRLVSIFLLAAPSDRLVSAFLLAASSNRLLNSFLLTESSDRLVSIFLLAASSDRLVSIFLLAESSDRLVSAFLLAASSDRLLNSFLLTESSDRLVSSFLQRQAIDS